MGYEIQKTIQTEEKLGYELHLIDAFSNISPEEALKIWQEHFEPLLLCSDEHDAERLQEFEKDMLSYIRNLKI